MKETVRLRGIARGTIERSKLDAGTAEHREHVEGKAFTMEVDGRSVSVDASSTDLQIVPESKLEGAWSDVQRDERAAIFVHDAESDLVLANSADVVLVHAAVRDGDPIALHAEVIERSFDQGTGHREAPKSVVKEVRALVIATGADADALLDTALREGRTRAGPRRREKVGLQRRGRWHVYLFILGLGCFGLLLRTLVKHWPSPLAADFFCAMCVAFGSSAFAWWLRVRTTFYREGRPMHPRNPFTGTSWVVLLGISFTFAPTPLIMHASDGAKSLNMSLASVVTWGLGSLGFLLLTRRPTKDQLELLDALLESRVTGTVRDPTPVKLLEAPGSIAVAMVSEEEVVAGSSPDIVVDRIVNSGTFEVQIDGKDEKLSIHPMHSIWASTVRIHPRKPDARVVGQKVQIHTDVVPVGASIIVAPEGSMFTSSPIFYAAPGTVDPRAAVAKARGRLARAQLALLILFIALVVIGTALAFAAGAPTFPHGGGD